MLGVATSFDLRPVVFWVAVGFCCFLCCCFLVCFGCWHMLQNPGRGDSIACRPGSFFLFLDYYGLRLGLSWAMTWLFQILYSLQYTAFSLSDQAESRWRMEKKMDALAIKSGPRLTEAVT